MFSSMFLSFREGLEAVLIVGIILTYLVQIKKENLSKYVYSGATIGIFISLIGGFIGFKEAQELEEAGEELFEGIMMLISSGLIGYFVVWMATQNRNMAKSLKTSIDKQNTGWGLFVLSFLSVLREGMELVTFTLTKVSENAITIASGTVIGIILAIIVGYLVFKTSLKLNLKIIFQVLGVILIFIGAELLGEGLVKLIPSGAELLETSSAILFAGISLIYFLKDDLYKIFKKRV
ncbi:FTR1 family iron permease [Tepidibacillus sp. LV47]|uniref:FTR1 family iron permease n=1 Tax=Tepidibacillus sp. LV47 TaxID=3398228 RepID=UPI003AADF980